MKRQLLTTAMVAYSFFAFCQSNSEEIDIMQSMFGMEKKAVAANFITLEDEGQANSFWTTYDEYETRRKGLGKKRFDLIARYASEYDSLDDVTMDKIVMDMMSLQLQTDKLIADYYKKLKKQCGVKPAAQFYQFEHYVLSNIRAEIMERIPLIDELKKDK